MNRKVLVIDPVAESREATRAALGLGYEVHCASDVQEGLALCRSLGPFAVALSDQRSLRGNGTEFLGHLSKGWPDTARILVAEERDLELALRALHDGSVFRFLMRSAGEEALRHAVEAGIDRFRQIAAERLLVDQLQFSRESLLHLTDVLEQRLMAQSDRVNGLERFTASLGRARSFDEVARVAAEACSTLLGRRVVRVLLSVPGAQPVGACTGDGLLEPETLTHPVSAESVVLGRVELDRLSASGERMSATERRILGSLAASAGMALSNLIHRSERDEAQRGTIYALARLAEHRDDDTGKHLDRVSEYCRLIAEGLRQDGHWVELLTDLYIRDLVLSAPLHDIGKVGIPDSILLKPDKLTEDEWQVMRTHTTIGAETLRRILENTGEQSFLRMGYEIALCHHERWDGRGYPRNLASEEIPLCARIVALADCYDALTTWRPYKEPWPHERALAYVLEMKGSQFDPAVVDAFRRRAEDVSRIRRELADPCLPAGERPSTPTAD